MLVSVIIATHNPDATRLRRTLEGLDAQTLARANWETVLIDNASARPLPLPTPPLPANLRVVRESELGLSRARRRGLREARARLCVFVDDDNVLEPQYLEHVARILAANPRLGAAGGKSRPEFETTPPKWAAEFLPLLAIRDHGDEPQVAAPARTIDRPLSYPANAAPIGAGMAVRREAVQAWLDEGATDLPDRRGAELTSAGDNDIVFSILRGGWEVGYFPELVLTHLIPASRLRAAYLARLNHGVQKSWMQVLRKHGANPWSRIPRWTVPPRKVKAWFAFRAWSGPAERIRWRGACGHFEGRAGEVRSTGLVA